MSIYAKIDKIKNRVINLQVGFIGEQETSEARYEVYNEEIHPWGPKGSLDIEPGLGWLDNFIQKHGYNPFVMQIPQTSE